MTTWWEQERAKLAVEMRTMKTSDLFVIIAEDIDYKEPSFRPHSVSKVQAAKDELDARMPPREAAT